MDVHRVRHQRAPGRDQPQRVRAADEQAAVRAPPVAALSPQRRVSATVLIQLAVEFT